jgi:RNA ligase (TIGR02306 family)
VSELKVPAARVTKIYAHAGSDFLDFVEIAGWRCIVKRGSVSKGDWGAYFPIDSVLPDNIMDIAFRDAKIKPKDGRVKTVKIRGEIAQGLFLSRDLLPTFPQYPQEGMDLAEVLGVVKYEPPQASIPMHMRADKKKGTRKKANPNFREYTDLQHLKWFTNVFEPGEQICITEKVHGTSARFGRVPTQADTIWKKFKKLVGLLAPFEWVYGSRKVQLQSKTHRTTSYYGTDVWSKCAAKYKLNDVLMDGEVVYGEIYGEGIQKGYSYGVSGEDRKLAIYDVQVHGKFLSHAELVDWCRARGLPMVPTLYAGPFSEQVVENYTNGPSVLDNNKRIREGCVVRPNVERHGLNGRAVYKSVSPAFLLGDNTDFH